MPEGPVQFLILSTGMSDVVVSRRRVVAAHAVANVMRALRQRLRLPGRVIELREYGAIVDLSGANGLLHRNRFGQIEAPSVGDPIDVMVDSVEQSGGRSRIALSSPKVLGSVLPQKPPGNHGKKKLKQTGVVWPALFPL
jgi:ribosomal protein S1